MNRSEWERKVIDESYKLDQYLKKSPPVLSEELKQTYTKLLDECEKALRRFEIEISAHPFGGNSFLKSLCEGIEKLILKIKDYLYLYRTWKPGRRKHQYPIRRKYQHPSWAKSLSADNTLSEQ